MPLRLPQGQRPSAADFDFHTAVQRAPVSGIVIGHRLAFARTDHRYKVAARHARANQVIRHRVRAFFREFLVIGVFADAVGVPTDPQLRTRSFLFQARGDGVVA